MKFTIIITYPVGNLEPTFFRDLSLNEMLYQVNRLGGQGRTFTVVQTHN